MEGEAVTLGGLDGQFEAQIAGYAGGPGAGGEDDLGRAELSASSADVGDAAVGGGEAEGLGALQEGGAGGFGQASEAGDEIVGIHLGVLGETHATGGAGPQAGDDFADSVLVKKLGGEAGVLEETGLFAGVVEAGRGAEDVEEAVASVSAIHAVEGGPFVVEIAAGEVERAEKGDGGAGLLFVGGGPETKEPGHEGAVETRFDVERAVAVQEPAQALAEDSGGSQRQAVARGDESGVAVGTAVADGPGVDDGDVAATTGKGVGGGDANDAGADYEYFGVPVQGALLFGNIEFAAGGLSLTAARRSI